MSSQLFLRYDKENIYGVFVYKLNAHICHFQQFLALFCIPAFDVMKHESKYFTLIDYVLLDSALPFEVITD